MRSARFVVSLLLIAIGALPALAQSPTSGADPQRQMNEARAAVSFPGGTVTEYVRAVRHAFPGANIAVAPGVESVRLAPVELTGANLPEAVAALRVLSESPVDVSWTGTTALVDGAAAKRRQGDSNPTLLRVWPMAQILSQVEQDDALSAVQTALELAGPGAEVRFHADSQLLMLRGNPTQIDAVSQTLDRLESVANWKRDRSEDPAGDRARAVRELSDDRDRLLRRISELEDQVKRLEAEARTKR